MPTNNADWLSTEQAAALWNYVLGLDETTVWPPVSANVVRRMCREGAIQALGVDVLDVPGRWYISKRSGLERIMRRIDESVRRCLVEMDITPEERERWVMQHAETTVAWLREQQGKDYAAE